LETSVGALLLEAAEEARQETVWDLQGSVTSRKMQTSVATL